MLTFAARSENVNRAHEAVPPRPDAKTNTQADSESVAKWRDVLMIQ